MNLKPGWLWERVEAQTKHALACGALHPLPTESELIEQCGVRFIVRILANIEHKERAKRQQQLDKRGADFNPFLPYEEDLFVTDLGETHVCLLNKFNVFDHHLLIVTRQFAAQTELLNKHDFAALAMCMSEIDGLAFYNGGTVAGASQPHKHLQYVPLPLIPNDDTIPIAALFTEKDVSIAGQCHDLPFVHALAPLSLPLTDTVDISAHKLFTTYQALCSRLQLAENSSSHQMAPYNLLATRQWMMLVPRSQEFYKTISINALGFAGSLFVRNQEELDLIRTVGPMNLLQTVGVSKLE